MPKVAIAVKVEPAEAEALKEQAKAQGRTISDMMLEALNRARDAGMNESKIRNMELENQALKEQLARLNRKPQLTKKITVPVTIQEHAAIARLAAERRTSMGLVLKQAATGPALPALQ